MTRVFKMTELKVTTDDKPGTLARVTAPIAEARININAICAWRENRKAVFRILTENTDTAKEHLAKAGFKPEQHDVIVLETTNEAGTLYRASQQLSIAGVDLDFCYSTSGTTGNTWIVFGTQPNMLERAMNVIP